GGAMASEIKLQALKESVDTVEVNAVKVAVGDQVARDQTLLEVQADKAQLEVPSPVAGRVVKLLVKVGDQIKVGQPYCVIEGGNESAAVDAMAASSKRTSASMSANWPPEVQPSQHWR